MAFGRMAGAIILTMVMQGSTVIHISDIGRHIGSNIGTTKNSTTEPIAIIGATEESIVESEGTQAEQVYQHKSASLCSG